MKRETKKGKGSAGGIARPRSQTLSTTDAPRRGPRFIPRFTLKLGDTIGTDLTIIGHLSSGRISELYQVWSISYMCALTCKILLPGLPPQSKEVRGFRREVMLLRRLHHPQIIRIFDQDTFAGREFLIQEYLHGPSLFELIDHSPERRLSIPDAIKVIIHVCSALDHLHGHQYIYRDVKPSNIILRGGIPVLVDFDSAYRLRPGHRPRQRIGTDPYMAPEQCLKEELYRSTDIYGVGAIFYEMLTGRWPFEDEFLKDRETKTLEDRYPQIGGNPPPVPERFNSGISSELSSIVLRCLERNPSARFQSARELTRRLVIFLEGKEQMWPESVDFRHRVA